MNSQENEVDLYVGKFSGETSRRLTRLRKLMREASPDSIESISYGLVGYKLNGKPLVYFGGFEKHIGFYATPNGHEAFKMDFKKYKQGKGSIQLPLDQPLPEDLIKRVVEYRNQQTQI